MKRWILTLVLVLVMSLLISTNIVYAETKAPDSDFSHYLVERETGAVISAKNECEHHEIASMVKIMSLNIVFEAIDSGEISLDDMVTVSKYAARQTGSELFIDEGAEYSVSDLIKGVVVVSANDATVALAEYIANNEDNFVKLMNDKAKEWSMNDTLFVNATGLPQNGQYSSAKDVTIMMSHLIEHEKYFDYAKIWTEDYTHPSGRITNLTNTNKLVRFYNGCDAGKTGYTDNAKFCLSMTAKRNDMRLVGTIIGAPTSKERFKMASNMLNNAFRDYSYKVIKSKDDLIDNDIVVDRARGKHLDISLKEDVKALIGRDIKSNIDIEYDIPERVKAPIHIGDKVGSATIRCGDNSYTIDIIARCNIEKSSIFDNFKDIAK